MEGALKWDGGEVRLMGGIAEGANEVLSLEQLTCWKAIPKLTIEDVVAYDSKIDDEWILGEPGNDV